VVVIKGRRYLLCAGVDSQLLSAELGRHEDNLSQMAVFSSSLMRAIGCFFTTARRSSSSTSRPATSSWFYPSFLASRATVTASALVPDSSATVYTSDSTALDWSANFCSASRALRRPATTPLTRASRATMTTIAARSPPSTLSVRDWSFLKTRYSRTLPPAAGRRRRARRSVRSCSGMGRHGGSAAAAAARDGVQRTRSKPREQRN